MFKIGIDWSQPSTSRGAIRLVCFAMGLILIYVGKQEAIPQLLLLMEGLAGGIGFAVKDQQETK